MADAYVVPASKVFIVIDVIVAQAIIATGIQDLVIIDITETLDIAYLVVVFISKLIIATIDQTAVVTYVSNYNVVILIVMERVSS